MTLLEGGDTTIPWDAQSIRPGPLDTVPMDEPLPVLLPAVEEPLPALLPTVEEPLPVLVATAEVPPDPGAELAWDTALEAPTDDAGGADVAREVAAEDPVPEALVAAPEDDEEDVDVLPDDDDEDDDPVHACVAARDRMHATARFKFMCPAVMVVAPSKGRPGETLRAGHDQTGWRGASLAVGDLLGTQARLCVAMEATRDVWN